MEETEVLPVEQVPMTGVPQMPVGETSLEEVLDFLLENSDPEGLNYRRLSKIKGYVSRGLLIGPSSRDYIASCLARLDRIECKRPSTDGTCQFASGQKACPFAESESWRECAHYEPVAPLRKGKPIDLGDDDD